MDSRFGIEEKGSTLRREIYAGVLTFLAVSYILAVNPDILAAAGMSKNAVFTATAVASAAACIIMGLYARFPVVLAPGMGINAFFAFTVVTLAGYTWQEALAASFVAGIIFLAVSITGLRNAILDAIPDSMRIGIAAGIGAFIMLVGLQSSGMIVPNPATMVALGDILSPTFLLAIFGIVLTFTLHVRKVKFSFILGIAATAAVGMIAGVIAAPSSLMSVPDFSYFGAFASGFGTIVYDFKFVAIVFSIFFVCLFDTAGTLLAVGRRLGIGGKGVFNKAVLADSVGMMTSAVFGTSPVTSYVESSVGVESGGRTGLVAIVAGLLFLVALFFAPIFVSISAQCTVAVLLIVGFLMLAELANVDYSDICSLMTAMTIIIAMVFTYSITNGIGAGFIVYVLVKIAGGNWKDIRPSVAVFTLLFIAYFITIALI